MPKKLPKYGEDFKKIVFYDTDKRHADLKIRLSYDNLNPTVAKVLRVILPFGHTCRVFVTKYVETVVMFLLTRRIVELSTVKRCRRPHVYEDIVKKKKKKERGMDKTNEDDADEKEDEVTWPWLTLWLKKIS